MDFFGKMGEAFSSKGKDLSAKGKEAAQKAKDVTEIAKLSTKAGQLEGKIKTWYQVIGEKVYQSEKDQEHAGMEVEFNMITDAFAEIGRIRKQIADLKGVQICPGCGSEIDSEAAYCSKCGTKQEKEAEEAPAEEACDCEQECCCEESPAEECCCEAECGCGESAEETCGVTEE